MANWGDLLNEIQRTGGAHDVVRRKYLKRLAKTTGRNVIAYYSGWLQKPKAPGISINDNDKIGLMTAINGLDRSKGLDLILHTPGGETAATESIVDYLRSMFDKDIRAIVPQLAMSAGTMIACSTRQILMGKHSSLGPIDPQISGMAAHGVLEEFNKAFEEIRLDQSKAYVWQPIIQKYPPTLIGECQKVIKWSEDIVATWLETGMLEGAVDAKVKIKKILEELGDHALTLSHARHLSAAKCKAIGLDILDLESDQKLQEAVLSVHHSFIHTLSTTGASKIIENQNGKAFIQTLQMQVLAPVNGEIN